MTADQLAMLQERGKTPENLPRYKHRLGERSMRTAELHAAVLRLAAERRLQVIHGVPRAMLAIGWPDPVIMGPGGVLFRKLTDEHSQLHSNSAAVLEKPVPRLRRRRHLAAPGPARRQDRGRAGPDLR
jgi:hypothetical protein